MPATKSKPATSWERLTVIEGDPCLSRFTLEMLLEEQGNPIKIRLGAEDAGNLRQTFSALSLYEKAPAYILYEFNAALAVKLLEIMESGRVNASLIVIMAGENGLDGRSSFAKEAKKHKRIMRLEPILAEDKIGAREHLRGWQEESGLTLDQSCLHYLLNNLPLRPIKGPKGNDVMAIDLDSLESELKKAAIVAQTSARPLKEILSEICEFDTESNDIWGFINAASSGDQNKILKFLDDLEIGKDNMGALWLLLSQLEFLLSLRSISARHSLSPDMAAQMLSNNPFSGRFNLPSGDSPENIAKTKPVNPWRVRKTIESGIPSADRLVHFYQAVTNAIRDLRGEMPPQVVTWYLSEALAGNANYAQALTDCPEE